MAYSKADKRGIALMIGSAIALLAMLGAYASLGKVKKPDSDGCHGVPAGSTVIVLDHSEKVAQQTRDEIVARALSHVDRLPTNERVTVFKVSELSKRQLEPAFSMCKPAREGNRLYEATKGLEKRYVTKFLQPLTDVLKELPEDGKQSPVAQALLDISLSRYLRSQSNSLLVFSDLLENTPKFSMYSCKDSQKAVAEFRESRRGGQERPKFQNTHVQLNIVPRADISRATLKCRDQVWAWFFGDNEGTKSASDVDYLPGS
jgi:hypothetical protein